MTVFYSETSHFPFVLTNFMVSLVLSLNVTVTTAEFLSIVLYNRLIKLRTVMKEDIDNWLDQFYLSEKSFSQG